jgi:DNA-binding MarR family transcriptional regulator
MEEEASRQLGRVRETLLALADTIEGLPAEIRLTPLEPRDAAETRLMAARAWRRANELRHRISTERIFGDPAWDLLLDLYISRAESRRVAISNACAAAGVPATTGLRWIAKLQKLGWICRIGDVRDGRRAFVFLTDEGVQRIESLLDASLENGRKLGFG